MTIQTKYLPATNTRGSRMKATIGWGRLNKAITVPYDHALDPLENHRAVMRALCEKRSLRAEQYAGDHFGNAMYWVNVAFT